MKLRHTAGERGFHEQLVDEDGKSEESFQSERERRENEINPKCFIQ